MIQSYTTSIAVTTLLLSSLLVACNEDKGSGSAPFSGNPDMDLAIPASLTGGTASFEPELLIAAITLVNVNDSIKMAKSGTGEPCSYLGREDEDNPFRNGYETTSL